jgi:hypothetical protein
VPKGKDLYSLVVGAHTIIKVIANAAQINASNPGEPGLFDQLTDERLF